MTRFPILRLLGGLVLLAAAGCASPSHEVASGTTPDPDVNHPITVEPSYRSLKLNFTPAGLSADDTARLDAFVADYRDHGSGAIAVSAPANALAHDATGWFADRINDMGISREKILVATHDVADGDNRVEINYVAYQAHTDSCGDWSDDLSFTLDNATPKNFGCSVQQNIAAMVADPRDLVRPRPLGGEQDGARTATILGKYEQGQIYTAEKRKGDLKNEQSGGSGADSSQ